MNYKIKITAENQAIVECIANKNGMNPNGFIIIFTRFFYTIENGIFERYITSSDFQELTTEQFIEMFDKQDKKYTETDMDEYAEYCINHVLISQIGHPYLFAKNWFQQFKKK